MKYLAPALLASFLLSACATGPTYLGHTASEASFKVDGGKTVSFPVTRTSGGALPLPTENENYKIDNAGIFAAPVKGNASESKLAWTFGFISKKPIELDSVIIEQVTDAGGLELIVKDDSPVLKNKKWMGKSASVSMTKELLPWLYSGSDSTFVFKFTMKSKDGSSVVMYQPSIIFTAAKTVYLNAIFGK